MDRRYIEDNQIIDRYLMNKLSAKEMEAFERIFLEDPEIVQEIELRKRFIRGIRNADRTGLFQLDSDESSGLWRWLRVTRPSFQTAAAAFAAILLIVTILQYSQLARLESANEKQANRIQQMMAPQANTLLVPLLRTRGSSAGAEPVVRVRLSSEVEHVILTLDLERLSFDNYRFSLEREGTGQLWSNESDNAPPAVVLPAALLIPGDYYFQIHGARSGETPARVAQFSFTVLEN